MTPRVRLWSLLGAVAVAAFGAGIGLGLGLGCSSTPTTQASSHHLRLVVHVPVPEVVGLPQASAIGELTEAGLTAQVTTGPSQNAPPGVVLTQNPASNLNLAKGSAVKLFVSTGPPGPPTS